MAHLIAISHFPQIRWHVKQLAGKLSPDLPVCLRTKIEESKCYATLYNLCLNDQEYLCQQHPELIFEFKEGSPPDIIPTFKVKELNDEFEYDGAKELYQHLNTALTEDPQVIKCFEDLSIRMVPFHWLGDGGGDTWIKNVGYVCDRGHIGLYDVDPSSLPAIEEILRKWSDTYTDSEGMVWQARIERSQFCYLITPNFIDTRPRICLVVGSATAHIVRST
jgi:hypothetical protein